MKRFIDGDCLCFTDDTFINLQESPAVFVTLDNENAQRILQFDNLYAASDEFLIDIHQQLAAQQHL